MKTTAKLIGWITVPEGKENTEHTEVACWQTRLDLIPGRYPIFHTRSYERDRFSVEGIGRVTYKYDAALWGGVPISGPNSQPQGKEHREVGTVRSTTFWTGDLLHLLETFYLKGGECHYGVVELVPGLFSLEGHDFVHRWEDTHRVYGENGRVIARGEGIRMYTRHHYRVTAAKALPAPRG